MALEKNFPKKIFDVKELKIKCCNCGKDVLELPFKPDPQRLETIRCQDCQRKWRAQNLKRKKRF